MRASTVYAELILQELPAARTAAVPQVVDVVPTWPSPALGLQECSATTSMMSSLRRTRSSRAPPMPSFLFIFSRPTFERS